jgi:HEAT repeat protein
MMAFKLQFTIRTAMLCIAAVTVLGRILSHVLPDLWTHYQIARLVRDLDSEQPKVRLVTLFLLRSEGESAVPQLIVALQHDNSQRRSGAAMALGWLRRDAWTAIPALIQVITDSHPTVRESAITALGQIDPAGSEMGGALISALSDEEASVRRTAAAAIYCLRDKTLTLDALGKLLSDPDPEVRHYGIIAAADERELAEHILSEITNLLDDENDTIREHAKYIIDRNSLTK